MTHYFDSNVRTIAATDMYSSNVIGQQKAIIQFSSTNIYHKLKFLHFVVENLRLASAGCWNEMFLKDIKHVIADTSQFLLNLTNQSTRLSICFAHTYIWQFLVSIPHNVQFIHFHKFDPPGISSSTVQNWSPYNPDQSSPGIISMQTSNSILHFWYYYIKGCAVSANLLNVDWPEKLPGNQCSEVLPFLFTSGMING